MTFIFNHMPEKLRQVFQVTMFSIAAALLAVMFMTAINTLQHFFFAGAADMPTQNFILRSFLVVAGSSFIVSLMMKKVPESAGSGIPEVKVAYWKELGYIPFKPVIIKFFAGIISIAGGASLGREGPTVFLGSGIASHLAGIAGWAKRQRRAAALIGASAGLAAAFNTPLAAIAFIIEEMVGDLNTKYLGQVVIASLAGALVVQGILGHQPSFILPVIDSTLWIHYFIVPFSAILGALSGILFQHSALLLRKKLKSQEHVPRWIQPFIGGILTWGIGIVVFLLTKRTGVFGLGYHDLSDALNNKVVWQVAGIILAGKLMATILSYSFGGCGGIFSPTLCIGGMSGVFISGLAALWIPLTPDDRIVIASVGMSACLGAVIRAPLTTTLIVFEMTHQFEMVPGLMLGAVITQLMVKLIGIEKHNFYDSLLIQDGHEITKINPPKDLLSWGRLPVSAIMNQNPVVIRSLDKNELKATVKNSPYQCFPYINKSAHFGVITRHEITASIKENRDPVILNTELCFQEQTLSEVSDKLIQSSSPIIIVVSKNNSEIKGILTLHDILRAQAAVME